MMKYQKVYSITTDQFTIDYYKNKLIRSCV